MRATIFAIIAMFLYAIPNVLIERKFAKVSPQIIIALFTSTVGLIMWLTIIFNKPLKLVLTWPQGSQWTFIVASALVLMMADFFYFSAYNLGGSLAMITTTVALYAVVAILIKAGLDRGWPTTNQIVAAFLAFTAVWLTNIK